MNVSGKMERKSRATSKPSDAELPKDPRERATSVDINQDPRYGATNAPDWLITFLSKQGEREYKREQLEQERERARDERHELSMRLLCETLDRRVRNNSPSPTESQLHTSLSIEMRATLQLAIGIDNDDDITVTAILDRIQEHVRGKRNVTLDRVALEERKQEEGEPFDQFYIALREIANNADLCQHCIDDRLTTRIMSGIRDPETRRKLLTYTPPPSLQTTVDVCRSDESARNDEATLANNDQGHTKIDKVGKKT